MHDDRSLVEARLARVLDQYVRPAVCGPREPLTLSAWSGSVPVAQALTASFEPFAVGRSWGAPWSTTWFRATGEVPPDWAGRRVEAVFDLGFSAASGPGFQ